MLRLSPRCSVAALILAGALFSSRLLGQQAGTLLLPSGLLSPPRISSSSLPESEVAAVSTPMPAPGARALYVSSADMQALPAGGYPVRPFRALAVQVKVGTPGIGIDLATPLSRGMNLRVGGSVFSYSPSFNVDGMTINGGLDLRSATLCLDWFPFHGGFRISPGVNLYNGDNLEATITVPGGNTFSLGNGDYTSSATDPVHGNAAFKFGNHVAPTITMGWGNMIPRSGRHFSVPFEFGIQYISEPTFFLNLAGTACSTDGCTNIATDPTSQANLKQEISDINSDIRPLRFFPIVSLGASWKF
jgi:hypothetical protein